MSGADIERRGHLGVVRPKKGGIEDVKDAWSILAAGAPKVAEELVRIAQEAESEFVRQQAAVAVLDRVGLGKVDGHVVQMVEPDQDLGAGRTATDVVRARLAALTARAEPSTFDGEVVEEVEYWDPEPEQDPEPEDAVLPPSANGHAPSANGGHPDEGQPR